MNYEFSLFHRNFVMAVSYGVTFAVMVVFLFIAFTGYLEVNKPRRAVFNTYQQVIRLLSTVQVSVSVFKWRENTRTCTCGMNGPGSGLTDGSRGTHRSFCTFSPAFFIFNTRQKQRKQWKPNHAHPQSYTNSRWDTFNMPLSISSVRFCTRVPLHFYRVLSTLSSHFNSEKSSDLNSV